MRDGNLMGEVAELVRRALMERLPGEHVRVTVALTRGGDDERVVGRVEPERTMAGGER